MHGLWKYRIAVGFFVLVLNGCERTPSEPVEASPAPKAPVRAGTCFNRKTTGVIRGRVTWQGPIPVVPSYRVHVNPPIGSSPQPKMFRANPNAPSIDPTSVGVRNAVVFLRGIDPAMGKPWNQPAVKIEVRDRQIVIEQGTARGPVGFVRRDASVTLVSRDPMFHSLHAGGAAFFTLTLPDAHRARTRALHGTGPVELTSAAGFYWMRAHLFVDEHPYYARTGPDGSYVLDDVPPGKYELVCWLPDWHEARRERDPESGQVTRVYFGHPVEIVKSMIVETGKKAQVSFFYRTGDFGPNRKR